MSVEAVALPNRLRAVPRAVWVLLGIAVLLMARSLTSPGFSVIGSSAFAAPVVFAAAVVYVAPRDRRFVWAALGLAATPTVLLITGILPDLWYAYAPGDWKNATPMLMDADNVALDVANLLELAGLSVLGLALGGVRSFVSFLIIALGLALALANLTWALAHQVEGFPVLELARSLTFATLHVLLLAFVFAAAVESLRNLTMVGAGLLFANAAISAVLLWWALGPDTNFQLLSLVVGGPTLVGWIFLIAAPLRGEFAGAAPRSRAARGTGARRPAG